jgi:capsular exopolysaccharide synthesis family protein
VVAGAIGYGISQRQPPVYQATVTIIVGQSTQSADLTKTDIQTSELLAQTYANIAKRQPVLQGVIQAMNLNESEQALKKRVTVKQVDGTQLLEITVEASSPEEARLTADELARQLILRSPGGLKNGEETEKQQFIKRRMDSLQTKIQYGQQRLDGLERFEDEYVSTERLIELQDEINTLETLIYDWEESYTQLLILAENEQSPNHLAIIEPAKARVTPVWPQPKLHALLATTIGLLLALGFVLLREYLDNTIKSADDFRKYLGVTPLGTTRRIKNNDFRDDLLTYWDCFAPWLEAYRMIRTNIQFMTIDQSAKSIIVTGALPGEGKSITTANLGVVMAQADLKTIIVDADLRRPSQHKIFHVPNKEGLTDLLRASEPDLNNYLKETPVKNLYLLTSGVLPSNPSELMGSQRMGQLLANLSEHADMVIFDSPPIVAFADAAVLSARLDGVIFVAMAGQTRLDVVRQAILNLQQVGANLLGGVLNGVVSKDQEYLYGTYYTLESLNARQQAKLSEKFFPLHRWRQWLPFSK